MSHTILILHGRGGSSQSRSKVGEGLTKLGYTVLIPDLPGFGDTPLPHAFTIDDYGQRVKEYLETITSQLLNFSTSQFTIIGHSNGGRIAISAVSKGILTPDHLILVNSAGIDLAHDPSWIRTIKRMLGRSLAQILKYGEKLPGYRQIRSLLYRFSGGQDYLKASADPIMKQTFSNCFNYFCEEEMKTLTLPTLLIRGENDTYTPLRQGKKMQTLIQHSQFIICEHLRHGIHLSEPERIITETHRFLSAL